MIPENRRTQCATSKAAAPSGVTPDRPGRSGSAPFASSNATVAGRPLSAWVRDLGDANSLIREEALEVLAQAGSYLTPAEVETLSRACTKAARFGADTSVAANTWTRSGSKQADRFGW